MLMVRSLIDIKSAFFLGSRVLGLSLHVIALIVAAHSILVSLTPPKM